MTQTVLEVPCRNRKVGEQNLRLRLLKEGPKNYGMDAKKIAEMWNEAKNHDVLFSDYTAGKFEPFLDVIVDPRGVWMEIVDESDSIVGVMYITNITPGFDAQGHFTFWDSVASGREPLALFAMEFLMDRYDLHRMSAMIPVYQKGVIRFTERLGFQKEGTIREAIPHKGKWLPAHIFGILRDEVNDMIERAW